MVQLSLGDGLALIGLAVTVVLWTIAPTPVLRVVALAFAWALVLLVVFALPGLKEMDWPAKVLITVGATLVAAGLAYTPIRDRLLQRAPMPSLAPSTPVYLHMEFANKAFNIFNDGTANLKLYGTRFGDGPKSIDAPRIISPNGGAYHIYIAAIEPEIIAKIPDGHDARVPFDLYLENAIDEKYIARFELWIRVVKRTIAIDPQLLSITKEDWQAAAPPAKTPEPAGPPSLLSLFMTDIRPQQSMQFVALADVTVIAKDKTRSLVPIVYIIVNDITANAKYVSFYVPPTPYTNDVVQFLPGTYRSYIADIDSKHGGSMQTLGQGPPVKTASIPFSGRVFVYSEEPLTLEQMAAAAAAFKKRGATVQFRSRDHVMAVWASIRVGDATAPAKYELGPDGKPRLLPH